MHVKGLIIPSIVLVNGNEIPALSQVRYSGHAGKHVHWQRVNGDGQVAGKAAV